MRTTAIGQLCRPCQGGSQDGSGLTLNRLQEKYAQSSVSPRKAPVESDFWGWKNVVTQPGPGPDSVPVRNTNVASKPDAGFLNIRIAIFRPLHCEARVWPLCARAGTLWHQDRELYAGLADRCSQPHRRPQDQSDRRAAILAAYLDCLSSTGSRTLTAFSEFSRKES